MLWTALFTHTPDSCPGTLLTTSAGDAGPAPNICNRKGCEFSECLPPFLPRCCQGGSAMQIIINKCGRGTPNLKLSTCTSTALELLYWISFGHCSPEVSFWGGSGRWRYGCLQCACIEERQCWGNSAQGHLTAICPLFPAFVSLCFSNLREFLFSKSCRRLSGWMFCLQSTSSTSKKYIFSHLIPHIRGITNYRFIDRLIFCKRWKGRHWHPIINNFQNLQIKQKY